MVGKPDVVPGISALGFYADLVVHGGSNALLAAEVVRNDKPSHWIASG
jgi:hypothetical protein